MLGEKLPGPDGADGAGCAPCPEDQLSVPGVGVDTCGAEPVVCRSCRGFTLGEGTVPPEGGAWPPGSPDVGAAVGEPDRPAPPSDEPITGEPPAWAGETPVCPAIPVVAGPAGPPTAAEVSPGPDPGPGRILLETDPAARAAVAEMVEPETGVKLIPLAILGWTPPA